MNFDKHREGEHNQWDYFYYLIYLTQKSNLDLNGFETYVNDKYKMGDISWFPIGKAIALDHMEDDNDIEDKLEMVDNKLARLIEKLDDASTDDSE